MKLNENTEVVGENIELVPYSENLVAKYHLWMQSPELLAATGSERLTLEEEYDNQKTWREDKDKLTFIILDQKTRAETRSDVAAMIGDINLILKNEKEAEVMIMIAEPAFRRRGYAREALLLLLEYAVDELDKLERFEAKIAMDNIRSIRLFESIGFEKVSESQVFSEVTMCKTLPNRETARESKRFDFDWMSASLSTTVT